MNTHFILRGFGRYAPERVMTNADLEKIVDTSDEWITTRTGIKERHIAADDQAASDMAYEAAKVALADAGMDASELTHIVCGTFTPDSMVPSTACRIQEKFGIKGQACVDIAAACSGFVYALETARGYIALNPDSKVLVVTSEVISRRMNWEDRTTCVLFGDAAGAAIVTAGEAGEGPEIKDIRLAADGSLGDLLTVNGGGSRYAYKLGETVGEEFLSSSRGVRSSNMQFAICAESVRPCSRTTEWSKRMWMCSSRIRPTGESLMPLDANWKFRRNVSFRTWTVMATPLPPLFRSPCPRRWIPSSSRRATPCLSPHSGRFHLGCSVDTVLILKHVFRCLFVATGQ